MSVIQGLVVNVVGCDVVSVVVVVCLLQISGCSVPHLETVGFVVHHLCRRTRVQRLRVQSRMGDVDS